MPLTVLEADLLAIRFSDLFSGACPHKTTHRTLRGCLDRELQALSNTHLRKRILEFEQSCEDDGGQAKAKPV